MGIDAIIVNGSLITDTDTFKEMADEASYLDVIFIFVQADRVTLNPAKWVISVLQ
jgi:hypothetical protein